MRFIYIAALLLLFVCNLYAQEIALTFDDAPTADGPLYSGKERTSLILDQLQKLKIPQVAFFVITGNIDGDGYNRLSKYSRAGHLLGNHTNSHQWIHQMGVNAYINDIKRADSVLRPMKGFTPWFRYPFLDEGKTKSVRDSIRRALTDLRLNNGYVTIDNYDWYLNGLLKRAVSQNQKINYDELRSVYIEHIWNSIQFYNKIAQKVLGRSPRHVLLLHENDLAAKFLTDLVNFMRSKGWKIISPSEAYKDPISKIIPDVLFNGQGRVGAIAREKGLAPKDLVQDSEDEVYLDEIVKVKNIFQ